MLENNFNISLNTFINLLFRKHFKTQDKIDLT